jgi:integrase
MAPTAVDRPWVRDLLQRILEHPASAGWRTSRSAHQNLCLIQKALRGVGLLQHDSLQAFEAAVGDLSEDDVRDRCAEYVRTLCRTASSARAYVHAFNIVFHAVYGAVREPLRVPKRRRPVVALEDLDRELSSHHSAADGHARDVAHLSVAETERVIEACRGSPRDALIVAMLSTTGLRRRGLLNIRAEDVARCDDARHWTALTGGVTVEKGRTRRSFPARHRPDGKKKAYRRRCRPRLSPRALGPREVAEYVRARRRTATGARAVPLPVASRRQRAGRDGAALHCAAAALPMSVAALNNLVRRRCLEAGIDRARAHPHVFRHSCAHRLLEQGNTPREIAAYLGHTSSVTTERFYLRDSTENIVAGMRTPWSAAAASVAPPSPVKTQYAAVSRDLVRELRAAACPVVDAGSGADGCLPCEKSEMRHGIEAGIFYGRCFILVANRLQPRRYRCPARSASAAAVPR